MSSAILGGHQLPICLLHCLHNKSTIQLLLVCKLTHVIQYVLHSNSNSDCTPTAILSYFRIPCNGFNSNTIEWDATNDHYLPSASASQDSVASYRNLRMVLSSQKSDLWQQLLLLTGSSSQSEVYILGQL